MVNPKTTQHMVTLNPNHLLFWENLILKPSKFTFMRIILHLITHIKMWINHVISVTPLAPLIVLDESSTLSATGDHLLQLDSTSLSFQLQGTSSVEIGSVLEFEGSLDLIGFSCFTFNYSSSRCSIRQINVWLFVSLNILAL